LQPLSLGHLLNVSDVVLGEVLGLDLGLFEADDEAIFVLVVILNLSEELLAELALGVVADVTALADSVDDFHEGLVELGVHVVLLGRLLLGV